MARLTSPRSKSRARMEIIPFIDIMFFLLATFMMVSLKLIQNDAVPVKLPEAASSEKVDRTKQVFLSVTADGLFFWNKEPLDINELPARLKTLQHSEPEARIFISGDQKANFGAAIQLLDAVRLAGITKVAIETRKPPVLDGQSPP